jgi:hypothetical protein
VAEVMARATAMSVAESHITLFQADTTTISTNEVFFIVLMLTITIHILTFTGNLNCKLFSGLTAIVGRRKMGFHLKARQH